MSVNELRKTLRDKDYGVSGLYPLRYGIWSHDGTEIVHDHDFIEIAIILSGQGLHHSINGDHRMAPGDVFVLRPGAWHAYWKCKNLRVFNCLISPTFLEQNFHFARQNPLLHFLFWSGPFLHGRRGMLSLHLSPLQLDSCRICIKALDATASNSYSVSLLKVTSNILMLLAHLTECIDEEQTKLIQMRPHEAVLAAIKFLEEDSARNWSLAELAKKVHLNHYYLVRLFKQTTGLPPLEYLAHYRAEQAARLLLATNNSITQIGMEVGWDNPSYFSQRFKALFGVTASEYRAQFRLDKWSSVESLS